MIDHAADSPADGVDLHDVPAVNRALFDACVQAASKTNDPRQDPSGFIEALWKQLAITFEWQPATWPADLDDPELGGM